MQSHRTATENFQQIGQDAYFDLAVGDHGLAACPQFRPPSTALESSSVSRFRRLHFAQASFEKTALARVTDQRQGMAIGLRRFLQ